MIVLAIETSCDETAVAILQNGNFRSATKLLASEVASQVEEHRHFGGVVPEVASRNHLLHLPRLLERACATARITISEIDAFAATNGPGLASSLLVGNSTARALAIGTDKPFLAINHLEGHLLSPFFPDGAPPDQRFLLRPHIALIVSGGHTLLAHVRAVGDYEILGGTLDDAAGEAFDKVAKLLGLTYPGGPEIEKRAGQGDPRRFDLPRSMVSSGDLNFSFSGLKTAMRYLLAKLARPRLATPREIVQRDGALRGKELTELFEPPKEATMINDLCASFQQAVIDVLREKCLRAVRQIGIRRVTVSGGVSCNQALRHSFTAACTQNGIELLFAEPWLCTDNAAMIAFAAMLRLKTGIKFSLSEEIDPNLALA